MIRAGNVIGAGLERNEQSTLAWRIAPSSGERYMCLVIRIVIIAVAQAVISQSPLMFS